jgi:ribosomal protein L16 Arg81 hydroxylase
MRQAEPKTSGEATTEGARRYPQVDRRSDLSIKEFNREYRSPGKPVVIKDAVEDWKARTTWTFEFFKSHYGDNHVMVYRYRGEKYKPADATRMRLADYIDGVSSGDWTSFPYYIRDNWALLRNNPALASDYSFPKYFFDWFSLLPPFMRLQYPRIFIGPNGSITPLHLDIWGTHAWLTQLVGRKRWILFAPDQRPLLYDHQVDPNRPDYQRFPLFRQAQGVECTIGPGETVFVPGGWAHWVESLDSSISLSSNYMGPGAFWLPLTSATRELVVKRAWDSCTRLFKKRDAQAGTAQ